MSKVPKDESFYQRFHQQLLDTSSWPGPYVFKFIIPTSGKTKESLLQLFKDDNVNASERVSSKGKYTSISIEGIFANPSIIIEKYKQAAKIPDIIQL
jgi:putative lipoic acid-binding regulatory protein